MLKITYRKHGIRLTHVWFANEAQIENREYCKRAGDIVFLHGVNTSPRGGKLYTQQKTVIKDLNLSKDELFLTLGKHLRQYIKRSKKEDVVNIRILDSEYLKSNSENISDIGKIYEKMFADKGMRAKFNRKLAEMYISLGALTFAVAFLEEKIVGFSGIIHDDNNARLWISAFDFRNDVNDSQVLSRAHQRLDWELLLWCKDRGITRFDFGGINSFEEPNGIAQFKLKFESKNKVIYNNYLVPMNLIGRIALLYYMRGK